MCSKIIRSSLLLVLITIISKVLGLLREVIMANYLGTGSVSDAYVLGTTLSQVVITGLAGSFFKTYLPTATKERIKSDLDYNNFTAQLLMVGTGIFLIISLMLFCTAGHTTRLLSSGASEKVVSMAIRVCRLTAFPSALLFAIYIFQGYLHTQERFSSNIVYPVVMNLSIIAGLVIGRGDITALSNGYSASIILSAVGLWIFSRCNGFKRYNIKGALKNDAVSKVFLLTLPLFFGGIVSELNEIIDRTFSAYYDTGTLTALRYGKLLEIFMTSAIGIAIGQAVYPKIATLKENGKIQELTNLISGILTIFCIISIPLLIGIILVGNDFVKVVFMRGAFNEKSALNTSIVFVFYSFSILPVCFNEVLSRVFFAYDDTKRPVFFSVIAMGINIILNIVVVFVFKFDFYALAVTTSVSELIMAVFYYSCTKKTLHLKVAFHKKIVAASIFCSCLMAAGIRIVLSLMPDNYVIHVMGALIVGVLIYLIFMFLMNRREITAFVKRGK